MAAESIVATDLTDRNSLAFLGTGPVRADRYFSPEYFALEREAIFRRMWLNVGREFELPNPGDFMVRQIEICNASVLIVRGSDGQIRAFHNVCSHRGAMLAGAPSGHTPAFVCPYHQWTYALDGTLRGIPDERNFWGLEKSKCSLTPVSIASHAGFLFINLDPVPAQTLVEFLGAAASLLAALQIDEYTDFFEFGDEIEANWKTIADNFQETYHVSSLHKKSLVGRITGPQNPFGRPLAFEFYGYHRRMTLWGNLAYRPSPVEGLAYRFGTGLTQAKTLMKSPESGAAKIVRDPSEALDVYLIFPNLQMLIGAGSCVIQQFWPISADRTRFVGRQYAPRAVNAGQRFSQEYSFSATRDITAEDWPMIQSTHRGAKSGAREYFHFHSQEALCRHLYNSVESVVNTCGGTAAMK